MFHLADVMAQHPITPFIREGDMAVRKPWKHPERRLLDYLLIYIQRGRCRFIVDGVPYDFTGGEYCLIQPGSLNDLEGLTDTVTPFAHFDIFYNGNRESSFPTRPGQIDLTAYSELKQPRLNDIYGLDIPVRLRPRDPAKFRADMLQMVELWQNRDPLDRLKAQIKAMELVMAILDDHYDRKEYARETFHSLNWITSYFSYHLREPLSIKEMAERAHLSPSRFNAVFKVKFGLAPHQYLLEMRIRHSCELLESTPLSQEEISSYCGFSDIHHFSKSFRKKMGVTPGQWRKRL
jgi:AraC-like DNA-binding protein